MPRRSYKLVPAAAVIALLMLSVFLRPGWSAAADSPYDLPKERFTLPNGLTVLVAEKHKLPLVQVKLLVKAGALYDPEEKAGLANLTGVLLDKGTSGKTALEIAESLDLIGASLSISPGKSATIMDLSVLLKDVREGLGIFAEVLTDPAFKEEEVEREKRKILSEIEQKKDKPRSRVRDAMLDMVYRDHAMRRPVEGYADTVPGITARDVRGFYRRNYLPGNSILVMVADMSSREMRRLVECYFGGPSSGGDCRGGSKEGEPDGGGTRLQGWKAGSIQSLDLDPPAENIGKRVRLIDMSVNQSYIELGMISLKRNNPDYNALRVMNYIMGGGGFVSRLLRRIRSEEGLAYSVYSYVVPGSLFKGFYIVALQTKIASTSQAMNLMLETMQGMREEMVTQQELDEAKSYYQGSLARSMETYSDVSRIIMDQEFYGLPDNYHRKDIEEINGLTREYILRVARKYIHLDDFNAAIVTKVDDLKLDVNGIDESMIETEGR